MSKIEDINPGQNGSSRPLTVLQVLPELESGGVERGTLELARYLARQGHHSLVISGGGRLVAQLEAEGSRHIKMPLGNKNPFTLAWIISLRRLLLTERVDILHLRSRMPAWIAYLAWKSLPAARRPRLVTTFHGFYSVNRYSAIMTKGEKVIAISQAVEEHVREKYRIPSRRISLIPRGVDTLLFDPATVSPRRLDTLRRDWGFAVPNHDAEQFMHNHTNVTTDKSQTQQGEKAKTSSKEKSTAPIIMLPGRISRWKGHDILLQALAQIKDLPWSAVCVGDLEENPGYAAQLQKLTAELGLEQRVRFVGHCSDMPAALLLADVVISAASTEAEAFGRSAIEAAAVGKPVIASAHGGSLETVIPGKTGWLVEPNNYTALATALQEALTDPERCRRMGRNGQAQVRSNYTMEKMCADTLSLYKDLCAGCSET